MEQSAVGPNTWSLPSERKYIITHPATSIAALHTSDKMIHPVWTKVSKTAWYDKTQLCGGYGRRMQNSEVSDDAPPSFFNPYSVPQPSNRMTALEASVSRLDKKQDPRAAAKVLPGGLSMLKALDQPLPHNRFRSLPYEKQTYLDPIVTERDRVGPINWAEVSRNEVADSARKNTNNALSGRKEQQQQMSENRPSDKNHRIDSSNLTNRSSGRSGGQTPTSNRERLFVGNTNR